MWNVIESVPEWRGFSKGLIHQTQVRGQAWMLRAIADAAYITPDRDSFKTQFETIISDNIDWYTNAYPNKSPAENLLGFISEAGIIYDNNVGVAPWQDDFFTSSIGHIVELGYTKAQPLLAWKIKFPISRMTGTSTCWIDGAIYALKVRDSETSPIYNTIGQAYQASHTAIFNSLPCGGVEMAASLGLKVGEMTGHSSEADGIPSTMQPALAFAADTDSLAGAAAWQVFAARSVKPDYSKGPQFAIIPR